MDIFGWIAQYVRPTTCSTAAMLYEHMESQSGQSLPLIYQPFDAGDKAHWRDRGAAFDFLYATGGQERTLLDFGPGDGWPALIVAPYAAEVVGVDGARRRVAVCEQNAMRLGIRNAHFCYVEPGAPLPFENNTFDGAMAASSLEQSPDPRATLGEIYRVLKPGGRLRIGYEALGRYRGGEEREVWLWEADEGHCRLVLYDRHIDEEQAEQYVLAYAMPKAALQGTLWAGAEPSFASLTPSGMERSLPMLTEARVCTTTHPSGETWVAWLREAGFAEVWPTHNGIDLAGRLFDAVPPERWPDDMAALDDMLRPMVRVVVALAAPVEGDPMITAVK